MTPRELGAKLQSLGYHYEPQMGGNCTAWMRSDENERYVLLTVEGGGLAPTSLDDEVLVGWYVPEKELPVRHEEGVLRDLLDRGVLSQ